MRDRVADARESIATSLRGIVESFERDEAESRALTLRFAFEHPEYRPATREVRYRSRGEIIAGAELRLDRVINLGTQPLAPVSMGRPRR